MKHISVKIAFFILVFSIIYSNYKIKSINSTFENDTTIIRYGENKKVGDIIKGDKFDEIVVKTFTDGTYITTIINNK